MYNFGRGENVRFCGWWIEISSLNQLIPGLVWYHVDFTPNDPWIIFCTRKKSGSRDKWIHQTWSVIMLNRIDFFRESFCLLRLLLENRIIVLKGQTDFLGLLLVQSVSWFWNYIYLIHSKTFWMVWLAQNIAKGLFDPQILSDIL